VGTMSSRILALMLTVMAGVGATFADDWPQWLGPNRDGISTETSRDPLAQVPQPLWKTPAGVGVSSVVVSRGQAYVMGHKRGPQNRGTDTVYCLDAAAGSIIWTHTYDCLSCKSQDVRFYGPRSTPTVDGERVYTLSLEGHLFCFETRTGKVLWARNLPRDLNGRIPLYGYCCSPLVYGDKLILELNAQEASYAALDKSSGDCVWRLVGGDITGGSPVLTQIDGKDQVVFMGGGSVIGADPQTGTQLWRHSTWGHAWMAPAVCGNRIFVANASMPRGCGLIRIDAGKPTVVWEDRAKKFQTLHCNSVIWHDHIYGFDNTGTDYQGKDSKKSALKCIELDTGRVKWVKPDIGWGNLIVYGGKLIILREAGELVVAKAAPEAYEELLRTTVFGGQSWTVPAIANGRLYCRNNAGDVVCLQLYGAPQATPVTPTPTNTLAQERQVDRSEPAVSTVQPEVPTIAPAALDQWPRFRGPGGLAVASRGAADDPKVILWKAPVPLDGESSPIVWRTHLFLTGASRDKREVCCFDTESGKMLWRREITATDGPAAQEADDVLLAASTPVTDGRCVFAIFGNGDVACLDFDGEVKWSRNLGVPKDDYGHASSLEIAGDLLFVQLDQGQAEEGKSKLMALHSQSGRTVWESVRPVPCSWSSPILINVAGHAQLITCAEPWLIAYEPTTGSEIWRANCLAGQIVSSPVYANGLVYVVSPDSTLAAIRPDGHGDVTRTHLVWTADGALPSIPSPVCNGELLWLVDTGGVVTCYDAKDGQKVWEKDIGASFQASPTIIGSRLYLLSDSGTLFILEAARQYKLTGRVELGEQCLASPAYCRDRMYVRTKHHLVCLGSSRTE
jgi:outer membrane protein assembly factor BamB